MDGSGRTRRTLTQMGVRGLTRGPSPGAGRCREDAALPDRGRASLVETGEPAHDEQQRARHHECETEAGNQSDRPVAPIEPAAVLEPRARDRLRVAEVVVDDPVARLRRYAR